MGVDVLQDLVEVPDDVGGVPHAEVLRLRGVVQELLRELRYVVHGHLDQHVHSLLIN